MSMNIETVSNKDLTAEARLLRNRLRQAIQMQKAEQAVVLQQLKEIRETACLARRAATREPALLM